MRKKTVLILGGLGLIAVGALLGLKVYQTDLIHSVVVNAVVQKTPEREHPRILAAFDQARRRAEAEGKEEAYVKRLLAFSQRLEKVQKMNPSNLERMLEELNAFDRPMRDPDAELQ